MLSSMFFSKIEVSHLYELQILVVEGQETSQNMVKTVRFIKCLYNSGGYIAACPCNNGKMITLPETNIAPENRPSQKETSLPTIHFQALC